MVHPLVRPTLGILRLIEFIELSITLLWSPKPVYGQGIDGLVKPSKMPAHYVPFFIINIYTFKGPFYHLSNCARMPFVCLPGYNSLGCILRKEWCCYSTLYSNQKWEPFKSKLERHPQACFATVIIQELNVGIVSLRHSYSYLEWYLRLYAMQGRASRKGLGFWDEWCWS